MTAEETTMALTLLASAMAQKMSEQQLVQTASLLTQLGATLGFIASQRALESTGQGADSGSGVTSGGQQGYPARPCPERTEKSPCPGSGPCPQSPAAPEGSSATGR